MREYQIVNKKTNVIALDIEFFDERLIEPLLQLFRIFPDLEIVEIID